MRWGDAPPPFSSIMARTRALVACQRETRGRSCGREGKLEGKIPCGQRICREFGPFRQHMRRKDLGFEGLAAKFPAWASRELFCAQQGMCREFFARSREFRLHRAGQTVVTPLARLREGSGVRVPAPRGPSLQRA